MSCCRAITDQLDAVDAAKSRLTRSRRDTKELANAISTNLDTCRRVLGTYRVSRRLTYEFRQEIEPGLANVWTSQDLVIYATKLQKFSSILKKTLVKWRSQYCKEAAA